MKSKKWLCVKDRGSSFTKGVSYEESEEGFIISNMGRFPIVPYTTKANDRFSKCFKEVTFKTYLDEVELL